MATTLWDIYCHCPHFTSEKAKTQRWAAQGGTTGLCQAKDLNTGCWLQSLCFLYYPILPPNTNSEVTLHWIGQASVTYLTTVILTSRIFFYTSQVSTVPMTWLVACLSIYLYVLWDQIYCVNLKAYPTPLKAYLLTQYKWVSMVSMSWKALTESRSVLPGLPGVGSSAYLSKVIEHWVVLLFINGLGIFYPGRHGYAGYNSPFSRPNEGHSYPAFTYLSQWK